MQSTFQWGIQRGGFGLAVMGTPVQFTRIRVMPNQDFDAHMQLEEGVKGVGAQAVAEDFDEEAKNSKNKNKKNKKKKKKKKKGKGEEEEEEEPEEEEEVGSLIGIKPKGE